MRRAFAAALFSFWAAAGAGAAVLPVDGTLSITLGSIGTVVVTGSGTGSSAGGVGSSATVPAGLINGVVNVTVPITPPILALSKITVPAPFANAAGSFAPNGAMANSLVANLFFTTGSPAGSVPLFYVGGGLGTAKALISGLPLTLVGATFTNLGLSAGNPTVTTMVMKISASVPVTVTATAFDKRTAGGAGTLQLVAPATLKIFAGALGEMPVVGTLTLQFVPEPGTLLLLGAGAAGLTSVARSKRK
jgi:hypothetical protein